MECPKVEVHTMQIWTCEEENKSKNQNSQNNSKRKNANLVACSSYWKSQKAKPLCSVYNTHKPTNLDTTYCSHSVYHN